MKDLSPADARYVDEMASVIVGGMISKGNAAFNTEYFRMICQSAYQLAIVMLEVKNEKINIVEPAKPEVSVSAEVVMTSVANESPVLSDEVVVSKPKVGRKPKTVKIAKSEGTEVSAKKRSGRPKGSKNRKTTPSETSDLSSL